MAKSPWVASYPRSEPARMTRLVTDAASNSDPVADLVGYTNMPLASGKGSGGRDHSFLRLFKPGSDDCRNKRRQPPSIRSALNHAYCLSHAARIVWFGALVIHQNASVH